MTTHNQKTKAYLTLKLLIDRITYRKDTEKHIEINATGLPF